MPPDQCQDKYVPWEPECEAHAPYAAGVSLQAPPKLNLFWGGKGHALIHGKAALALPDEMPAFFRNGAERLEGLASQPDRWKLRELPHLKGSSTPDHYAALELLKDHQFPKDRYSYVLMIDHEQLAPDYPPQFVGTLPYKIAELQQQLTCELAIYRHELARSGPGSKELKPLEENVLHTAGMLGHYVGDASQPLHTSAHSNGWRPEVEPNPNGFSTDPEVHRKFETLLVNASVDPESIGRRMTPARRLQGDPLDQAIGMIRESHQQVRPLFQLEKEGKLEPTGTSPEGLDFVQNRLAVGASNLRDMWFTAWLDSAALVDKVHDPE